MSGVWDASTSARHAPVLLREAIEQLAPRSGGIYVDATLGRGGHAEAILEASAPDGRLIGIDRDPRALEESAPRLARFGSRARLIHAAFADVPRLLEAEGSPRVHGLLADLGTSSPQLDDPERGFSFRTEGPLDMRMDPTRGETAAELIARTDERDLADILYRLGEERRSRPIARSIKRAEGEGRMRTTGDLRAAVVAVLGPRRVGGIDPATRTFQALRLAVNGELDQLDALLAAIPELLEDRGVAVILSFHSLEDRAVKRAFRGDQRLEPTTKKPIVPSEDEERANPRSRSAKLRAARRIARTAAEGRAAEPSAAEPSAAKASAAEPSAAKASAAEASAAKASAAEPSAAEPSAAEPSAAKASAAEPSAAKASAAEASAAKASAAEVTEASR